MLTKGGWREHYSPLASLNGVMNKRRSGEGGVVCWLLNVPATC